MHNIEIDSCMDIEVDICSPKRSRFIALQLIEFKFFRGAEFFSKKGSLRLPLVSYLILFLFSFEKVYCNEYYENACNGFLFFRGIAGTWNPILMQTYSDLSNVWLSSIFLERNLLASDLIQKKWKQKLVHSSGV